MSVDRMKQMIANAINQKASPDSKYKDEYIVEMSMSQRCFLECTAAAFHIPTAQCGSVESARDQIRIKMKGLSFPIWCLKYVLNDVSHESTADDIKTVLDAYCGIANTANSNQDSESSLAEQIGSLVNEKGTIISDLEHLLTNELCRKGMLAYIDIYQDGLLRQLANEIGDGGAYLERVKQKFNADAANWVWSSDTADEKISDVILEYQIIAESNKSLPKCLSLKDVVIEWNKRSNNIKMPYEVLKKYSGDLVVFLAQLYRMKLNGQLQEQEKKSFYSALVTLRESFESFYRDQLPYFKQSTAMFIDELDEQDVAGFFGSIPSGQFTKSGTEYYQYIEKAVDAYKKGIKKEQLRKIWIEKTGTKDPADWSERYDTPILCMFDDSERGEAKEMFGVLLAYASSDADIDKAITYLNNGKFFGRLNDPVERDQCFMKRVVGDYSIMLKDADAVRKSLLSSILDKVYNWMDNSAVQNRLKVLAEKQYKLNGCERAQAVIDKMDATELRHYLNELIADNLTVGMEILKNE